MDEVRDRFLIVSSFFVSSQISLKIICAVNIFGYLSVWSFVLEYSIMPGRYQINLVSSGVKSVLFVGVCKITEYY